MDFSNTELEAFGQGLVRIRNVDHPIVANRVGLAYRQIRDHLEALEDAQAVLLESHAERFADGSPVKVLDDHGKPSGFKIKDVPAYRQALRELMAARHTLPDMKGITWGMLRKGGFNADGALKAALGDFLQGEPDEDMLAVEAKKPAPAANVQHETEWPEAKKS